MKKYFSVKNIGVIITGVFLLVQGAQAATRFLPLEKLVKASEIIVVAQVYATRVTGSKTRRGVKALIAQNELKVLDTLKGTCPSEKSLFLNTYRYEKWMEDNVELPPAKSKVLLFLRRDRKELWEPVNSIQGVWKMIGGKPAGAGWGTTLDQVREIVKNQAKKTQKKQDACHSKLLTHLLDTAEAQTQAGHYKKALALYRKAYRICPMRDLEEQMAWLLAKIDDEQENNRR